MDVERDQMLLQLAHWSEGVRPVLLEQQPPDEVIFVGVSRDRGEQCDGIREAGPA